MNITASNICMSSSASNICMSVHMYAYTNKYIGRTPISSRRWPWIRATLGALGELVNPAAVHKSCESSGAAIARNLKPEPPGA